MSLPCCLAPLLHVHHLLPPPNVNTRKAMHPPPGSFALRVLCRSSAAWHLLSKSTKSCFIISSRRLAAARWRSNASRSSWALEEGWEGLGREEWDKGGVGLFVKGRRGKGIVEKSWEGCFEALIRGGLSWDGELDSTHSLLVTQQGTTPWDWQTPPFRPSVTQQRSPHLHGLLQCCCARLRLLCPLGRPLLGSFTGLGL